MLEAKVLGQLMLMQSVLNNLPDNKSIFSFVCRGLKDVPGIETASYSEESSCCENENTVCIPITRGNTNFGEIMIIVSEKESFLEYENYLKNFFFMIEVLLEERRQFEINKLHNLELEQRVEERTKQLTEEIEERNKIAENLKESEFLKNTMVANIGDVIVIIDHKGISRYKSPNVEKLFGWKTEELIGNNAFDNVHPDDIDHGQNFIASLLSEPNKTGTAEVRYRHKNGNYVWIEFTGSNLLHDPIINGILGNYHDISERKMAENELIKAKEKAEESDLLKSAFLANMSHEIRTPMNAILGFASLLRKENLTIEKKEKYLELIESGGNRLLNLISDIVDISKIDANQISLNYEACKINNLLDNLQKQFEISTVNQECVIKTQKGLKDAESIISIDETRLLQILSNLLENALKFTKKGNIEFGYAKENEVLKFFVKDDGIGIDPKDHKCVFDRFTQVDNNYSRSGSGTGLGLAIVKSLVNLLKGDVWVESEIDKGATFYFTIPYQPEKIKEDNSKNENLRLKRNEEITILIAEDEFSNYIYLEALLEAYNYKLIHVKNGKDAVTTLENNKDVDLVLMDINMPVMNGYEATVEIRKANKIIPIIALTAYAMETDRKKALESGCNDYLSKPLQEDKLNEIIRKYIE